MKEQAPKARFIWIGIFVAIFILSQDYLFIEWDNTYGLLGFPTWIFWFIGVHALFVCALIAFSKKYGKN